MDEIDDDNEEEVAQLGMREGMTLDDARSEITEYAKNLEPREIRILKAFYPRELHGFIGHIAKEKSNRQKEYEKTHQEVDTLQTILETKDHTEQLQKKIVELTKDLNEMRSKFDETSAILKDLIVEHDTLKSSSEKDKEMIESLNAQTAELTGEIKELKNAVENKDDALATKDKELADKDDIIKSNDDIIKNKDDELHDKITQISQLESSVGEIEGQANALAERLARKDELIEAADGEKASLQSTIDDLRKEIKEKDIRLQATDFEYFKKMREQKAKKIDEQS
jgi:chromosome segregation ATPase